MSSLNTSEEHFKRQNKQVEKRHICEGTVVVTIYAFSKKPFFLLCHCQLSEQDYCISDIDLLSESPCGGEGTLI